MANKNCRVACLFDNKLILGHVKVLPQFYAGPPLCRRFASSSIREEGSLPRAAWDSLSIGKDAPGWIYPTDRRSFGCLPSRLLKRESCVWSQGSQSARLLGRDVLHESISVVGRPRRRGSSFVDLFRWRWPQLFCSSARYAGMPGERRKTLQPQRI